MFGQYAMHLMSWWALFGATLALGLSMGGDDGGSSSAATEPEPEPEKVPEPFQGLADFDPDAYDEIWIGSSGDDEVNADTGTSHAMAGLDGNDTLDGSYASDYILGGTGDDAIYARLGDDTIHAGAGDDYVSAGWQNDFVSGGRGNDTIDGLYGDDLLHGDSGNDQIVGFDGSDTIEGGTGNDTLSGYRSDQAAIGRDSDIDADGPDSLSGGDGDDELWLAENDIGEGGEGADRFITDHRFGFNEGSAVISDYNADEDQIFLFLDPTAEGETAPEVTQQVSEDGEDRLILVDGVQVAQVTGAGSGGELDVQTVTEMPPEQAPQSEPSPAS